MSYGISKKAIDKHFQDHWTKCPIQYEGTKYDDPTDRKWISLQFIPTDAEVYAFDGADGRKMLQYILKIRIFEVNPQKAFDLSDEVRAFLDCKELGSLQFGLGEGDGNGAVDLERDCFMVVLDYNIKEYQ